MNIDIGGEGEETRLARDRNKLSSGTPTILQILRGTRIAFYSLEIHLN